MNQRLPKCLSDHADITVGIFLLSHIYFSVFDCTEILDLLLHTKYLTANDCRNSSSQAAKKTSRKAEAVRTSFKASVKQTNQTASGPFHVFQILG